MTPKFEIWIELLRIAKTNFVIFLSEEFEYYTVNCDFCNPTLPANSKAQILKHANRLKTSRINLSYCISAWYWMIVCH